MVDSGGDRRSGEDTAVRAGVPTCGPPSAWPDSLELQVHSDTVSCIPQRGPEPCFLPAEGGMAVPQEGGVPAASEAEAGASRAHEFQTVLGGITRDPVLAPAKNES